MTRSPSKPTGRTRKKRTTVTTREAQTSNDYNVSASVQSLRAVQKAEVKKYTTVKNTVAAYSGHLARGRKFLSDLVAKRRKNGEDVCSEGIPTDELEKAFDKPPNRWSAVALELFLVDKCFLNQRKSSTADGIQGAFAELWDTMDGDRYAGEYSLDETTGLVRGCPARAASVKAIVKSVKTRAKSKGESATRNHADAITIEEMKKMMEWSEKECPNELLTNIRSVEDIDELRRQLEHGFMRAFMSSAFTLWTRCFELLSLQATDIEDNCQGPAPYYLPHFKVHLTNRKGWQNEKGYDGPRTSNIYDIYQQPIPEIDMNSHFLRWRDMLESHLGVPLKPEDFLFPHIAVNGVVRCTQQMSYDCLQGLLSKFCNGAGVCKQYTTHSFRRGGAQYRFMFAPSSERWSLNRIRWWGGWAVGEHVDTLIKYLVDSLQSFENGHGNALHPIALEPDVSFMGNHVALKPVTTEQFHQLGFSLEKKIDALLTTVCRPSASLPPPVLQHPIPSQSRCGGDPSIVNGTQTTFQPFGLLLPSGAATVPEPGLQTELFHYPTTSESPVPTQVTNKAPRKPPIPNVSIPSLGRAPGAWRRAIIQWEEKDPVTNLALKDWPVEWYSGEMRTITGSKRSQRQIIVEEYERLGRDENRFLALYPNAEKNMSQLLSQIRANSMKGRRSKNGSPDERVLKEMPLNESASM